MDTAKPVADPLVEGYLEAKLPGEMTPAEFDRWMSRGSILEALDDAATMATESGVGLGELLDCLQRRFYARLDVAWLDDAQHAAGSLPPAA